jgi:hypothetical protein
MKQRTEFMLFAAVVLSGCAAPLDHGDADQDEPVESQAEALNFQPNFDVGVIAIKGSSTSSETWTSDLAVSQ